jgi:hypothetical protein
MLSEKVPNHGSKIAKNATCLLITSLKICFDIIVTAYVFRAGQAVIQTMTNK